MTNFKTTVRVDSAVSAGSPLLPPIKALSHRFSVGGGLWREVCPPPPVAGSQNRANFPFYQIFLFIGFSAPSSRTLLSITQGHSYHQGLGIQAWKSLWTNLVPSLMTMPAQTLLRFFTSCTPKAYISSFYQFLTNIGSWPKNIKAACFGHFWVHF